jgi:CHRD domain
MKTSLALGSALALLLVSGVSNAAIHKLTATMTGAQEAPTPVTTTATGTASVDFDDATGKVSGTVTFKDLHANGNNNITQTCSASHIHTGAVGAPGAPIVTFICAASTITSKTSWCLPER